jgi:hypothetical protein
LSGSSNEFPPLEGYNAIQWEDIPRCKSPNIEEWAVSVDSPAIVKYRELHPEIDLKAKADFVGISITQVDRSYWR